MPDDEELRREKGLELGLSLKEWEDRRDADAVEEDDEDDS